MRWFRRVLAAGASLLAMTAHASAEPISLAVSLIFSGSALGGLTIGGIGLGQLALTALAVGTSIVQALAQPKVNPGEYRNTFETGESSEVNAIGRVALGGLKAFGNTKGVDRYRLICHAKGPLVAVEEYLLGGRPVTVDPDGTVSSPPYAKPGGSWVTIKTKTGDGTETAWPELVADFPSLWTADHRVRGIAQSLVHYVSPGIYTAKFGKLYQGGEPDLTAIGRFNHVYDPRVSGADPDDEATYVWSQNGPLCTARIMSTYPDLTMASFDWEFISGEADRADALVETLTGTEPRSRCSGVWLSESKRGETMQQVLDSCGLEITTSDEGLIRIGLVDDAPEADLTLPVRHMLDFEWRSGPEAVERPNICRVRYYSAERNYEMADINLEGIGWARIDDEVTRYGEKVLDVELPFCPSASQAQRLARRAFLLARADVGTSIMNMVGLAAWDRTYVGIEFPDHDETPLCRIAPPRTDDGSGEVEIPFTVWPQELIDSPWAPEAMEAAAPDVLPDLQYESELDKPAAPSAATLVQLALSGTWEIRTLFAAVAGGTVAEANYRTFTGGLPDQWASMTEIDLGGSNWLGHAAAGDLTGEDVDFRCRFFNAADEGSYFSDLREARPIAVDNSTPSAPVIAGDSGEQPTASAPAQINVAGIKWYEGPDGSESLIETADARPGQGITAAFTLGTPSFGETLRYVARFVTADGTESADSNVLTFVGV